MLLHEIAEKNKWHTMHAEVMTFQSQGVHKDYKIHGTDGVTICSTLLLYDCVVNAQVFC